MIGQIDSIDPAFAPATGTPETGGWSTRELRTILRGLDGLHGPPPQRAAAVGARDRLPGVGTSLPSAHRVRPHARKQGAYLFAGVCVGGGTR